MKTTCLRKNEINFKRPAVSTVPQAFGKTFNPYLYT